MVEEYSVTAVGRTDRQGLGVFCNICRQNRRVGLWSFLELRQEERNGWVGEVPGTSVGRKDGYIVLRSILEQLQEEQE